MLKSWFSKVNVATFVAGITSMGLEILAGRVLAPAFGSSIYTWGSIIGVSLLALSIGYHVGGRRATNASLRDLDVYLLYASLYILFLYFASDMLIDLSKALPVPTRYAAILPMGVLFGPPTYALGFISPYAAELSDKQGKGAASGHFYAVGTTGSLIGAFGTTFLLIPYFSTSTLYVGFASLTALPLLRPLSLTSLTPLLILVVSLLPLQTGSTADNTVFSTQTQYQELRVADQDGIRTLYLDGHPQSAMDKDNTSRYVFQYTEYFDVPLGLANPDKALFIGGGGFSGPKRYSELGVNTSVVELDPAVIDAAKTYFDVQESDSLHIHQGDGRRFLEDSNTTYDVVAVDAFRKDQIPFHLTTKEFYTSIKEHLSEDGVVLANVIGVADGPGSSFARSQYKTMKDVFQTTYYMPTTNTSFAQNIEIIATDQQRLSRSRIQERLQQHPTVRFHNVSHPTRPDTNDVPLLTDGYAPTTSLIDQQISTKYVAVKANTTT
jgi:spermidine synthase